jgi:hypothetical protein
MKKKMLCAITIGLAVMSSLAVAAAQEENGPRVQHDLVPASLVRNPAPPSDARSKTEKSSIGRGRLEVSIAQPVSFWEQNIAIGNSRTAQVTTDFLFDNSLGIIYGYRVGDFACGNGDAMHGGVLEARYTATNKSGKSEGSGWYAVELRAGKCGANEAGVYGCKFDASGTSTECGMATINSHTGELDVAAQ